MGIKQTSKLAFPGVTDDVYELYDAQARTDANAAKQAAQNALNVANGKLKSAVLQTSYQELNKTLSITIQTNTK